MEKIHVLTSGKRLQIDGVYDCAAAALAERADHQKALSAETYNRRWRKQWLERKPFVMTRDQVNARPVLKAYLLADREVWLLRAPEAEPLALRVEVKNGNYLASYCDPRTNWLYEGRTR